MVDDNYHYPVTDESHRYEFGKFNSLNDARNAAMKIVDDFLIEYKDKVNDEKELSALHFQVGEDPFILNDDPNNPFSARTYAGIKCEKLFEK